MESQKGRRYLVDTNVLVDHLRDVPAATEFLLRERKRGKMWISTITVAEVFSGKTLDDPPIRRRVIQFMRLFRLASLDGRIAIAAGTICRTYGTALPDALIASTALVRGFKLYTRNLKHFQPIKGLEVSAPY